MVEASITQSNMAGLIGTTQPAVSQWLTGKKEPTPENLADLARNLKVRQEWLAEGIPPMRLTDVHGEREEYKTQIGWGFRTAPNDGGRDYGNANVWSFDPGLDVLVREVLQNTKDAALSRKEKLKSLLG